MAPFRHTLPIPKLELMACLLISRSVQKVVKILKCCTDVKIIFCSSSLNTLCWIKFDLKKRPIFVQNRGQSDQNLS